jgi:hypothetical protein
MNFRKINAENFMLYAIGQYTNPQCEGMTEFEEDLSRIKYVKRLLKKYHRTGKVRPILLLNHLTILGNVFTPMGAARMLFFKLDSNIHPSLKTALLYLNYIGEGFVLDEVVLDDIPMDGRLAAALMSL